MIPYFIGYVYGLSKLYEEVEDMGCRKFIVQKLKEVEEKMKGNDEILEFYRGYIYALCEIYAEIKGLPESEKVFDLIKSALKDFELEVRERAKKEESSKGENWGKNQKEYQ